MSSTHRVDVVLPAVDDGFVASGLYALSERLGQMDPENQSHGLLGGEWGYGQDYANDVFEMFPFWWGDCECGFDEREAAWCEANDHKNDCYQAELRRRGAFNYDNLGYQQRSEMKHALAKEWGLPDLGCAVHCTCGHQQEYETWRVTNDHDPRCPTTRPNFKHFASGLEVRWYKYIGRSMEMTQEVSSAQWLAILSECMASLSEPTHSGANDNDGPDRIGAERTFAEWAVSARD